jgi:hypothetical protein
MASKLTLKLLVDSYDQYTDPADPRKGFEPRTKGDVFEARDQAEYDRLTEIGAALDPQKAQEAERGRLEAERTRLEAEKAKLDEQLKELPSAKSARQQG